MGLLFTDSRRRKLRALATSFVPETALATEEQWAALEAGAERAIAGKPAVARRLVLLVSLLDLMARIRSGRRLDELSPATRLGLLAGLARSRLLPLRRGIWGLRTLVMLGWYTQPEVAGALGYRASPAGWAARR